MLFDSIDFAIFLPLSFVLYWAIRNLNLKIQNSFLVVISYLFYGWWDWRFLILIIASTAVDYLVGLKLFNEENHQKRKVLLCISLVFNLGLLGFYKYFDFFIENFSSAFNLFGAQLNTQTLNIILPVGISFYTFQTLSYSIDIYRSKLVPTKNFINFSAFVCFFPQLVAGPIERATDLLPQFSKKRIFDYNKSIDGLRQILWGLFKKVVIADGCAEFANQIFNNSMEMNSSALLLGAFFFTFQIYGDFSGYSDIAIGTARLFGFDLKRNFSYPYFSRDIAEFWRKWHISLSTWFRDYLYIPLGGSQVSVTKQIRNVFIIFVVSGFWHGANWTFIVWGALNAMYFIPYLLTKKNRINLNTVSGDRGLPSFKELFQMLFTFSLTVIAWVFFRAENISHSLAYLKGILSKSIIDFPNFQGKTDAIYMMLWIILLVSVEWLARRRLFPLEKIELYLSKPLRHAIYYFLIVSILWSSKDSSQFIYFQF